MTDCDVENVTYIGDTTHSLCDESKCVSKGLSVSRFNDSFACYGDENGEFYPMVCADGYEPRIVLDGADPVWDDFPSWVTTISNRLELSVQNTECLEDTNNTNCVQLKYFTCCPPGRSIEELEESLLQRHCQS